jgi:hypothetical protein
MRPSSMVRVADLGSHESKFDLRLSESLLKLKSFNFNQLENSETLSSDPD